jgi:hypothetical protein
MTCPAWNTGANRTRLLEDSGGEMMPTRLGNVLRRHELEAGAPYALEAVTVIPRLLPVASDSIRESVDGARTQLDLSVTYCLVWSLAALIALGGFADDGWWIAWTLAGLLLAIFLEPVSQ